MEESRICSFAVQWLAAFSSFVRFITYYYVYKVVRRQ